MYSNSGRERVADGGSVETGAWGEKEALAPGGLG